ncbi:MAG: LrgB family protein [Gammaproteobacteria bacterium]|nr:LrgB family protein [Gammaproteobacteria bacterium]
MTKLQLANQVMIEHPLFGLLITLACFQCANVLYNRLGRLPVAYPLVVAALLVVAILELTGLSYRRYLESVETLNLLLGTVTVALAVPLYESLRRLRTMFFPVMFTVACSAVSAVFIVMVLAEAVGLEEVIIKSLATKSVTTPIALSITEDIGGKATLAVLFILITGLFAPLFVPILLKIFPAKNDAVTGIAIGVSAHAIGTAKALEISRECGAFSALAMSLMGLMTAFLLPLIL